MVKLKLPALEELLTYDHSQVKKRYQEAFPNNKISADEAFTELMKYFWITQKLKIDKQNHPEKFPPDFYIPMHEEMHEIDDMWHTFLLFTRDYTAFSKHYFGVFIHHTPTSDEKRKEIAAHFEEHIDNVVAKQLEYIRDNLGEETLRKWFACYF